MPNAGALHRALSRTTSYLRLTTPASIDCLYAASMATAAFFFSDDMRELTAQARGLLCVGTAHCR